MYPIVDFFKMKLVEFFADADKCDDVWYRSEQQFFELQSELEF